MSKVNYWAFSKAHLITTIKQLKDKLEEYE